MATLFHDATARQIIDSVRKLQSQYSNIAASLAIQGLRRHEVRDGGGVRLVQPQNVMYAAYGGNGVSIDYSNVASNATAISTGNYVANNAEGTGTRQRRIVYDQTCRVWDFDGDGNLYETDEYLEAYNPGSLPIGADSFVFVQKHAGRWVAMKPASDHASNSVTFECDNQASSGTSTVTTTGGDVRFIHDNMVINQLGPSNAATNHWCHSDGAKHIYIHHPGTYKITLSIELKRTGDWSKVITDSNGDTHDSEYDGVCNVVLIRNFIPASGSLATQWGSTEEAMNFLVHISPTDSNFFQTWERTTTISHTLDTTHGQPYLRLNTALELEGPTLGSPIAGVRVGKTIITITATGGGGYGGNEGSGYNAFLGTAGAFQWYGGGSAPPDFDEYGV